ncbi:MAG: diguanylate cyclase, partial [Bacteroidetes bacterium]
VWFGTYNAVIGYGGSLLMRPNAGFTIISARSLGLDEKTGYLHVRSIFEDSRGVLWIGNNGIGVLRRREGSTINFSELQGLISPNSLRTGGYRSPPGSLEHVFSIGEDQNGNIWFGDRDTGAWRYDGKTMENFTQKDGLTTTHIWQIYKTRNGALWFAMGDGAVLEFDGTTFHRVF